jgi:hypothetical protein
VRVRRSDNKPDGVSRHPCPVRRAGIDTLVVPFVVPHSRHGQRGGRTDVLANLGVIAAGLLVSLTASPWPDRIIGALIGVLVMSGALRILRFR